MPLEYRIKVDLGNKKALIFFYENKGWDIQPENERESLTDEDQINLATFVNIYISERISNQSKDGYKILKNVKARYHAEMGERLGEISITRSDEFAHF